MRQIESDFLLPEIADLAVEIASLLRLGHPPSKLSPIGEKVTEALLLYKRKNFARAKTVSVEARQMLDECKRSREDDRRVEGRG